GTCGVERLRNCNRLIDMLSCCLPVSRGPQLMRNQPIGLGEGEVIVPICGLNIDSLSDCKRTLVTGQGALSVPEVVLQIVSLYRADLLVSRSQFSFQPHVTCRFLRKYI